MLEVIRYETWNGHEIMFNKIDGTWYASFHDICKALELDPDETIEFFDYNELPYLCYDDIFLDEEGIYHCLLLSQLPGAVALQSWTVSVLKRFRIHEGLEAYEAFRMCDEDVQESITRWLDTIFYNEETGKLYVSKTVPGGDVEQVEIENIFSS